MYDPQFKIQLILPVYEDREALERTLSDLVDHGWPTEQITVVDASKSDPFPLENPWGIQVIIPPENQRGRARQMNYGAANTVSDAILFLHADTLLPPDAYALIFQALQKGAAGGGFRRKFVSSSRFLKITCWLAGLRGKWLGWYFGDQAIFCRRQNFELVGGFPDIHPFEDLSFCRRLKKTGRLQLINSEILTSARRFAAEGPWLRSLKDLGLTLRYFWQNPDKIR